MTEPNAIHSSGARPAAAGCWPSHVSASSNSVIAPPYIATPAKSMRTALPVPAFCGR